MTKRMVIVATLGMALAASLLGPQAARAGSRGGATDVSCTYVFHVEFDPPITPVLQESTVATTEPGSISCSGTFEGRRITGPGTIDVAGKLVSNCAGHVNDGVATVSVPTERGRRHFQASFTAVRAGVVAPMTLSNENGEAAGAGYARATPDAGQNCVSVPLSSATVDGAVRLVR